MQKTISELLTALGWTDLGPQKNKVMISFTRGDVRMNVYFTTMTVTLQNMETHSLKTIRDCTLEDLEKISYEDIF